MTDSGTSQKVEIKTEDYELTVNGELYGKIADGDSIMVKNGKVYRNGVEILPTAKTDQTVDQTAEQDAAEQPATSSESK